VKGSTEAPGLLTSWRHDPANALPRLFLPAVVSPQISPPPSANSTAATALDVAQNVFGQESINR
jgi:hypothetical protein